MSRRALIVGIDRYINPRLGELDPEWELQGCVNDARSFHDLVTSAPFGYRASEEIRLLLDDEATRDGIQKGLAWLLDKGAYAGGGRDVRLFYFAGHGTYVADESGDEVGPGGERDEVLVTHDHSWDRPLRDDDLRRIFDRIPDDVTFTFIADCCHSGTIQKQEVFVDIAPETADGAEVPAEPRPPAVLGNRFLPPPGEVDEQIWTRREELDRTLKLLGVSRGAAYLRALEERAEAGDRENRFGYVSVDRHVLLAGCRDVEYAEEIRTEDGTVRGAFTWSLEKALEGARQSPTLIELIENAVIHLEETSSQTPQLECSDRLRRCRFLEPSTGAQAPSDAELKSALIATKNTKKEKSMADNLVRFLAVVGSHDKQVKKGFWSKTWSGAQRELAMRMAGLSEAEKALVKNRNPALIDDYLRRGGGRPIGDEGGGRPIGDEGGGR